MIGFEDSRGVSPVVAVILMVAISVILSASVGVAVFELTGNSDPDPTIGTSVSVTEGSNGTYTVSLISSGADAVEVSINGNKSLSTTLIKPGDEARFSVKDGDRVVVTAIEEGNRVLLTSETQAGSGAELSEVLFSSSDTTSGIPAPSSVSDALVSYYHFNDAGSASVAEDDSGPYEGDVVGDATFVSGKNTYGMDFSGDGSVNISNAYELPVTATFWIKPDSTDQNSPFIKSGHNWTNNYGWQVKDGGDGDIEVLSGDSWVVADDPNPHTAGAWTHVAVTITSSGNGSLYINGSLYDTDMSNGDTSNLPASYGPKTFLGNGYRGVLDDVRFFNRVLTGSEIQDVYNAEK